MRPNLSLFVCVVLMFLVFSTATQCAEKSIVSTGTLVVSNGELSMDDTPVITSFISQLAKVFKAAGSGNVYAILVAMCNLLVAMLKNTWVQGKLSVWTKSAEPWMTKRQKVFLTLLVGVSLVYLFAPKATIFWTLAKGLEVALCSIGTYTVYKHLRGVEIN